MLLRQQLTDNFINKYFINIAKPNKLDNMLAINTDHSVRFDSEIISMVTMILIDKTITGPFSEMTQMLTYLENI